MAYSKVTTEEERLRLTGEEYDAKFADLRFEEGRVV